MLEPPLAVADPEPLHGDEGVFFIFAVPMIELRFELRFGLRRSFG